MIQQAERNPEMEKLLKKGNAIERICSQIKEGSGLEIDAEVRSIRVSYRLEFILQNEPIRDMLLRTDGLDQLRIEGKKGILLLFDPDANANWSHPCWIATYDIDGDKIKVARHGFPPQEERGQQLVIFIPHLPCSIAA